MSPFFSRQDMTSYQDCVTFLPSNIRCKRKRKQKKLIDLPGIDRDDHFDQLGKVALELLQAKADLHCWLPHIHCPVNFKSLAGVDAYPVTKEVLKDATVGTGLHGISHGDSISIGECKAVVRRLHEGRQRVGVEGGAGCNVDA
jgi:hypothetical protein